MNRVFISLGAMLCLLAVILGALAAHALKSKLSANDLTAFNIANQYHFYHALGLIINGVLLTQLNTNKISQLLIKISGCLMISGIVLFSGSLYLITLSDIEHIGLLTPLGGICLILSWLLLIISVLHKN